MGSNDIPRWVRDGDCDDRDHDRDDGYCHVRWKIVIVVLDVTVATDVVVHSFDSIVPNCHHHCCALNCYYCFDYCCCNVPFVVEWKNRWNHPIVVFHIPRVIGGLGYHRVDGRQGGSV